MPSCIFSRDLLKRNKNLPNAYKQFQKHKTFENTCGGGGANFFKKKRCSYKLKLCPCVLHDELMNYV